MNRRSDIVAVPGKQPKRVARRALAEIESSVGRREANRRQKLARISEAARALFRRKGFDATSTQEVADRAGIAVGTLFLYAQTKEDLLLLAFLGEILDVLQHLGASAPARGDLAEQVLHLFEGMFAYHAEDIDLTRHLLRELAFVRNHERRDEVGQVIGTAFNMLEAMVRSAQRSGEVEPSFDPRAVAMDLFSLFFSPMAAWSNEFITRDLYIRSLRRSVALVVAGLKPQGAKAG